MPAISGSTRRSQASWPRRRRMNAPRDSSSSHRHACGCFQGGSRGRRGHGMPCPYIRAGLRRRTRRAPLVRPPPTRRRRNPHGSHVGARHAVPFWRGARSRGPPAPCPAATAAGAGQRQQPRRHQPGETLGQIVQPAAEEDKGPLWPRRDTLQPIAEADLSAQADAARLGGEEGIGTPLDDEAVDALGDDLAAQAVCPPRSG